jgi:hypothetical protein
LRDDALPTTAKTIGIVRVSRWTATVTTVPAVTMMSGCRPTNSFASEASMLPKPVVFPPGRLHPNGVIAVLPKVYPQVAPNGPTQARKRLRERREARLKHGIVFVVRHEHADPPHPVALLRPRRKRRNRRAPETRDELPPPHP